MKGIRSIDGSWPDWDVVTNDRLKLFLHVRWGIAELCRTEDHGVIAREENEDWYGVTGKLEAKEALELMGYDVSRVLV